jgi:hypothetical protein
MAKTNDIGRRRPTAKVTEEICAVEKHSRR